MAESNRDACARRLLKVLQKHNRVDRNRVLMLMILFKILSAETLQLILT